MLTLEALTYIEGHARTGGTIWNDATCTLTPFKGPDTMLNRIALSISTAGNLIYNEKYEDFKLSLGALNNNVPNYRQSSFFSNSTFSCVID